MQMNKFSDTEHVLHHYKIETVPSVCVFSFLFAGVWEEEKFQAQFLEAIVSLLGLLNKGNISVFFFFF